VELDTTYILTCYSFKMLGFYLAFRGCLWRNIHESSGSHLSILTCTVDSNHFL